jgi:hypothetical protein
VREEVSGVKEKSTNVKEIRTHVYGTYICVYTYMCLSMYKHTKTNTNTNTNTNTHTNASRHTYENFLMLGDLLVCKTTQSLFSKILTQGAREPGMETPGRALVHFAKRSTVSQISNRVLSVTTSASFSCTSARVVHVYGTLIHACMCIKTNLFMLGDLLVCRRSLLCNLFKRGKETRRGDSGAFPRALWQTNSTTKEKHAPKFLSVRTSTSFSSTSAARVNTAEPSTISAARAKIVLLIA